MSSKPWVVERYLPRFSRWFALASYASKADALASIAGWDMVGLRVVYRG
jgi:hypothetical protein